jgi:hypothetical protein
VDDFDRELIEYEQDQRERLSKKFKGAALNEAVYQALIAHCEHLVEESDSALKHLRAMKFD